VDMLDRTVRHQQLMLKIKIYFCRKRPVESLPQQISFLRMSSLQHPLQGRLSRSIEFKDLVGFIGPVDCSTRSAQAEAPRVAYALPLSQESFAALQIREEAGILQRYCGLRSQQLQHCNPLRREGARCQIVLQIKCAD
jgi:hypothetical protein